MRGLAGTTGSSGWVLMLAMLVSGCDGSSDGGYTTGGTLSTGTGGAPSTGTGGAGTGGAPSTGTGGGPACTLQDAAVACDDQNPCTDDACFIGVCAHRPASIGSPCPDGLCDGHGTCALGAQAQWSKSFGDTDYDRAYGVAVGKDGGILVVGSIGGTVDFGGGPLVCSDAPDAYVAKFDAWGKHQWSKRFGSAGYQAANGVAVDSDGNVVITGAFYDTVDFGGGPLVSAGYGTAVYDQDVFLAKLDPAGNHLWSKRFGVSVGQQYGQSVAVDVAGNVVVTGGFSGSVDFGGGLLTSATPQSIFVAKFDPAGHHLWSKSFPDAWMSALSHHVAVDAAGNAFLAGSFGGTTDFGGGPLTSNDATDVYLAKLDPAGNHLWSKRFGGYSFDECAGLAVDAAGAPILGGSIYASIDFGGGILVNPSLSGYQGYVAKLDPDGQHLWSTIFAGSSGASAAGRGLAVDATGNVALTGTFDGAFDFGGGPVGGASDAGYFLTKLGKDGTHLFSKGSIGVNDQNEVPIAAAPGGGFVLTGSFYTTVDFGTGSLGSHGTSDVFLAKLVP